MRNPMLLWLILFGSVMVNGQQLPTELICRWSPGIRLAKTDLVPKAQVRWLAEEVSLLTFPDSLSAALAIDLLKNDKRAQEIQFNYRINFREIPNDPQYFRQANMQRAGYEQAWSITTGGETATGIPIVTAILDGGFDTDHEDLIDNLWRNEGEVPDDGLDNDGNGYVDDVTGWNFVDNLPEHLIDSHGTSVAGLIGARGNNSLGVSGTNWEAQLMLFSINTVADIIAAYEYVIDQRKRFNESGGSAGAFVVTTNASFGIEGATCEDFPVWGGMYDRLGEVGILTAASVANVSRDADIAGDMPVDCPSQFLIGVTNVDSGDGLFSSSGYGREHVDLAAPGEQSFTTLPGNRYGTFGSTSAASPYVSGAIALLYGTPACNSLIAAARSSPAASAARVRSAILQSVRPASSLEFRTATGGIIDVGAAQRQLLDTCVPDETDFAIEVLYPNPTRGTTFLQTTARALSPDAELRLTDALGRTVSSPPYRLLSADPVKLSVDLTALAAGFYVIAIRDGERRAQITFIKL